MFNNKQKIFLSLLFCGLINTSAMAGFDVAEPDEIDYYGNAEDEYFREAVSGTEELDPADRSYLNAVQKNRVINRWYVRALVGQPRIRMSNMQNETSAGSFFGAGSAIGQPITLTSIEQGATQVMLIGGYRWQLWALDLELWGAKRLNYYANPLFANNALQAPTFPDNNIQWKATIQQWGLFLNAEFIFPRFFDFYPKRLQIYLDAAGGGAVKNTNSSTYNLNGTPRQTTSTRTLSPAAILGVGGRFQVTSGFLVDLAYKYITLGKTNFGPVEGIYLSSNKMTTTGFFLGGTYMF